MSSNKIIGVALAVFLSTAVASYTQHDAHPDDKQITVRGELIDTACYLSHSQNAAGEAHRQCALMCTKKGVPMSVLNADGELYLLLPDHSKDQVYEQTKAWAADQVEVTGRMASHHEGLRAIVMESSRRLSE